MRQRLPSEAWTRWLLVTAGIVLALALGLCLLDGAEMGMGSHHGMSPDYCAGLVALSAVLTLLGLAGIALLLVDQARPAYAVSLVRLDPPPRSFRLS